MFASKRLFTVTLNATRVARVARLNLPLLAPASVSVIPLSRGYATPRRGASSRPVQVKERPAESKENTNVAPHVEDSNVSYQQTQDASAFQYQQHYGTQASELINSSVSLQTFLKRTMVTTGVGIGGAAVACAGFMQLPFVMMHPYISLGVGAVGAIGSLFGMSYVRPTYVQEGEIVRAINPPARQALFATFLVGEGLTLAPMLGMVAATAPMAIPVAGSLALGTMAGMVAYALKQPQGSLARWGPALYVGLVGLIVTSLVNMFVHSPAITYVASMISIGIFSGFTAYDTQTAIDEHNAGQPDHLLTAANFFINFINLFLDYLRLIRGFFSD